MSDDVNLRAAEQGVLVEAMREVMFGGPRQQGLVFVAAETSKQVIELMTAVKLLSADVNGADGIRADIRDIRNDIKRMQKTEDRLDRLEALSVKVVDAERERTDIHKRIDESARRLDGFEEKIEKQREAGPIPSWVWGLLAVAISVIGLFVKHAG